MDEELKHKLDNLFEEIEELQKDADLFHISGGKSDFTMKVEELRGMHESVCREYEQYQKGKLPKEHLNTGFLESSNLISNKIHQIRKELPKNS